MVPSEEGVGVGLRVPVGVPRMVAIVAGVRVTRRYPRSCLLLAVLSGAVRAGARAGSRRADCGRGQPVTTSVLWFRRDLRLGDNPALLAAQDDADEVLPLFVLDPRLRGPSGAPRLAFLSGCLHDLREATGGRLLVRSGDPAEVVPQVAREVAATGVHVAADYGPYGARRDAAVQGALAGLAPPVPLVRTGSSYAVAPGVLRSGGGTAFKVFTPYYRAWLAHGVREPATSPGALAWTAGGQPGEAVPAAPGLGRARIPPPGESAARERFSSFVAEHVRAYGDLRDTPGATGTSRLSAYLKYGCVHPRSLLAQLGDDAGSASFRGELAWRDFYADVLWHRPGAARDNVLTNFDAMRWDDGPAADARFEAWATGRTGFPLVDAGMRQLLAEAWVHNRVRMVVASFLVKDLHLDWRRGAAHFMHHLVDGDLASNQLGWQWVAGTGTDPAPFFRVFNPTAQAEKFDPDGDYVRAYVPELRGVAGGAVHQPWLLPGGPPGYPAPVVDHRAERAEALERYAEVRRPGVHG